MWFILFILFLSQPLSALTWKLDSGVELSSATLFAGTTVYGTGIDAYVSLQSTTSSVWWDPTFKYKAYVVIANLGDYELTNHLVSMIIKTQDLVLTNRMKLDGSDIRFVDKDEKTKLPFYLETGMNSLETKIWVKIPRLPKYNQTNPYYIWMYYGNSTANEESDDTLLPPEISDDFTTNPVTSGRWNSYKNSTQGTLEHQNYALNLTNNEPNKSAAVFYNGTTSLIDGSWKLSFKYKVTNDDGENSHGGEGLTVMFYKDESPYRSGTPDTGDKLGFTVNNNNVSGYGVEVDAVSETDNRYGHFSLIQNSVQNMLVGQGYNSSFPYDEAWHTVEITFARRQTDMLVGLKVDEMDRFTDYTIPLTSLNYRGIGFSAATGDQAVKANKHIVDDFKISRYAYPPVVSIEGAEFRQGGNYFSRGYYQSQEFDTQKYAKIKKVSWSEDLLLGTSIQMLMLTRNQDTPAGKYYQEWVDKNGDTEISVAGRYLSFFVIFNGDGLVIPKLHSVSIDYGTIPDAKFNGVKIDTTTFKFNSNETVDYDGFIEYYFWDFGDGYVGTGKEVTHTYDQINSTSSVMTATTYKVTLNVIDNDGYANNYWLTVNVRDLEPIRKYGYPVPIAGEDMFIHINEQVVFDGSKSYDPDGTDLVYADWGWEAIGPDKIPYSARITSGPVNTSLIIPYKEFIYPTTYTVYLTVWDQDGNYDSDSLTVLVRGYPTAKIESLTHLFRDDQTALALDDKITVTATKSEYVNGKIVAYHWDFGDGTNSTAPVITHSYANQTSSYTVKLTVRGDDNLTSITSVRVMVTAKPIPVAEFIPVSETGVSITFDASRSYDPDGRIAGYTWDFGDGTKSNDVKPTHIYTIPGIYKIILSVTDDLGLRKAEEFTLKIDKSAPPIDEKVNLLNPEELHAYPNPIQISNQPIKFSYSITDNHSVYIAVFDLFGKLIQKFEFPAGSEGAQPGWNTVEWNGKNITEDLVYSGVYIAKILITDGKEKKYRTQKFAVYR